MLNAGEVETTEVVVFSLPMLLWFAPHASDKGEVGRKAVPVVLDVSGHSLNGVAGKP